MFSKYLEDFQIWRLSPLLEHDWTQQAPQGHDMVRQTQDEVFPDSSLKFRHTTLSGFPGPKIPVEKEQRTPLQGRPRPAVSHRNQDDTRIFTKDDSTVTKKSPPPPRRRHLEAIVDNAPEPNVAKRSKSPPSADVADILMTPPKKKLRRVPPHAPRDIERKGKYTFHKGVQIRDYRVPVARLPPVMSWSRQFQCRDSFDGYEIPAGLPRPMNRSRGEPQFEKKGGRLFSPEELLTPQHTPLSDSPAFRAVEGFEIKEMEDQK